MEFNNKKKVVSKQLL